MHAEGFDHGVADCDWSGQLQNHSLGWVCARDAARLVGFVNVAWDGGSHAFILDTLVGSAWRHRGVGTALVLRAAREAAAAGCERLHVDFEDDLRRFYFELCGFVVDKRRAPQLAKHMRTQICGLRHAHPPFNLGCDDYRPPRAPATLWSWRKRPYLIGVCSAAHCPQLGADVLCPPGDQVSAARSGRGLDRSARSR